MSKNIRQHNPKKRKPSRKPALPSPPPNGQYDIWTLTSQLLETYAASLSLIDDAKYSQSEILKFLIKLDTFDMSSRLLDRDEFENMPRDVLPYVVDLYTASMMIDLAKKSNMLEFFEKTSLIRFQTDAEKAETGDSEISSGVPEFPIIVALLKESPLFNDAYMAILHDRLEAAAKSRSIIPITGEKLADPKAGMAAFFEIIGFKGLFDETQTALEIYLKNLIDRDFADDCKYMARKGVSFFFMWHLSLGHFNSIISELVHGPDTGLRTGICPDCRDKQKLASIKVKSAKKFRSRYKNT